MSRHWKRLTPIIALMWAGVTAAADNANSIDISGRWVSTEPRTSTALHQTMTLKLDGENFRKNGQKITGTLECMGTWEVFGEIIGDKIYLGSVQNYWPDVVIFWWLGKVKNDHEIEFTHWQKFYEKYQGTPVPNLDYDHEGGEQPFENYKVQFTAYRSGPQD